MEKWRGRIKPPSFVSLSSSSKLRHEICVQLPFFKSCAEKHHRVPEAPSPSARHSVSRVRHMLTMRSWRPLWDVALEGAVLIDLGRNGSDGGCPTRMVPLVTLNLL